MFRRNRLAWLGSERVWEGRVTSAEGKGRPGLAREERSADNGQRESNRSRPAERGLKEVRGFGKGPGTQGGALTGTGASGSAS